MDPKTPSLAETLAADPAAEGREVIRPMAAREGVSASDGDTRLLQERLALFGLTGSLLSFLAFVLMMAAHFFTAMQTTVLSQAFHAAAIAVSVATWLIARGPQRSKRVLQMIDAAATVGASGFLSMMTIGFPPWTRPDLIAALSVLFATVTRASIVPSSPRRTLIVSALAWTSVYVVAYVTFGEPMNVGGEVRSLLRESLVEAFTWTVLGVTLVSVTSRIIYGLRRDVREAQKLGQYTLLEKLGEGGMGQVFRARHAMLRRPTAVKLLHPDRVGGAEDLARFEREVQLTAQLSHPNVVTVFDYGRTPDGVFYYAMELLEGQNLEDVVELTGPMPAARAVHILAQVASALAEAHAVGLIHRDIKPANIILCARGSTLDVAKVVDFGLVKQLGAAPDEIAGATEKDALAGGAAAVSRTGTILGTPMYLAPEALRDPGSLDGRADLYALGAVAYFLVTGTVVFGGTSVIDACRHHLHTVPEAPSARLRSSHPQASSIPKDLEEIVLQCLAKAPADRPANARDLLDALTACAAFGKWTDADARKTFDAKQGGATAATGAKTETSWTAKTIAVDFVERRPPEPLP